MRRSAILITALLGVAFAAASASGSTIVGRNVSRVTLSIDTHGKAHISYAVHGRRKWLTAWGAINARAPRPGGHQVKFRLRYGQRGKGKCLPYDGPALPWLVKACKAPHGSYWALQSWQRLEPNYGGTKAPHELQLSHWRGALPVITIYQDWVEGGRYRHLFGRFTYHGHGVFGYKSTPGGNPLDSFGRNVYVDTFNSAYGTGWKRENSFLTHTNTGVFCYSVNPHGSHPAGKGEKYRATVEGPGVTPDVMWEGLAPGPYDKTADVSANDAIVQLGDRQCRAN